MGKARCILAFGAFGMHQTQYYLVVSGPKSDAARLLMELRSQSQICAPARLMRWLRGTRLPPPMRHFPACALQVFRCWTGQFAAFAQRAALGYRLFNRRKRTLGEAIGGRRGYRRRLYRAQWHLYSAYRCQRAG